MIMIMILHHSKLHMQEICAYMPHIIMHRILSCIFCFKKFAYFKRIFRYEPASLLSVFVVCNACRSEKVIECSVPVPSDTVSKSRYAFCSFV